MFRRCVIFNMNWISPYLNLHRPAQSFSCMHWFLLKIFEVAGVSDWILT